MAGGGFGSVRFLCGLLGLAKLQDGLFGFFEFSFEFFYRCVFFAVLFVGFFKVVFELVDAVLVGFDVFLQG